MDRFGLLFAIILIVLIIAFLWEPLRRMFTRSKWDVFVSHRRTDKDNEIVKPIINRLKQEGFRVWIDWDEIPREFGPLFRGRISEGIHLSSCALLFISKEYGDSPYCLEETAFFLKRFAKEPKRIIEVRLDESNIGGSLKIPESVPIYLKQFDTTRNKEEQYDALAQEIISRVRDLAT